jgi:deoxyadenosine/deoxycytidine kinase
VVIGDHRPLACYFAGASDRGEVLDQAVSDLLEDLGFETRLFANRTSAVARATFQTTLRAIEEADLVVLNLDGGGAAVAGIAYGKGKPCVGLTTDGYRGNGDRHIVEGILDSRIAGSLDELRHMLAEERVVVDLRTGEAIIDLRRLERSYVVVSGPLGVGKTTLIDLLSRTGIWTVLPEPVMENPYLSKVYANLTDYAFRNQAFYLGQRAALHNSARHVPGAILQERCLSEDAEVFNRVMHDRGALDDDDLETLMTLSRGLLENAPKPDLILYLTAPFETTVDRIQRRDRMGERDLDLGFLGNVYERYEQWADRAKPVPLLRIDTSELDYANRPEDAAETVRRVETLFTDALVPT